VGSPADISVLGISAPVSEVQQYVNGTWMNGDELLALDSEIPLSENGFVILSPARERRQNRQGGKLECV